MIGSLGVAATRCCHALRPTPRIMSQPDPRPSIAPPLDAERIIIGRLRDHAAMFDAEGRPTEQCATCGRLPVGLDLLTHQARGIRNRLVQAGLMSEREP